MSMNETIEQPFTIGGLKSTREFRWLIKKDNKRILQQLFQGVRPSTQYSFPTDELVLEWRDVQEVIEE